MCIICNMPDFKDGVADDFLSKFSVASQAMTAAATAMLECAKIANTPEARSRYDATHKKMVQMVRDWNRLEQEREAGDGQVGHAPS